MTEGQGRVRAAPSPPTVTLGTRPQGTPLQPGRLMAPEAVMGPGGAGS